MTRLDGFIKKYIANNLQTLTLEECEEGILIVRYLKNRCQHEAEISELEGYILQLEIRKAEIQPASDIQMSGEDLTVANQN